MSAAPDPWCSDVPEKVESFADAFVDFAVAGIFFPSTPAAPQTQALPTRLPAAERLVAVGDLHGDLPKAMSAFRLAGLVDASGRWAGGSTVAVQVGDIFDRGGDELRLLYRLHRLKLDAAAHGGMFLPILGNHEIMNVAGDFRFVTPGGLNEFVHWGQWFRAGLAIKRRCGDLPFIQNPFLGIPKSFRGIKKEAWEGIRARIAALRPGGPISCRFLANIPTVAVVGDSVFVHGGLLEGHVKYGLEKINEEVRSWILGDRIGEGTVRLPQFVRGKDSVVWLRKFSTDDDCDCDHLHKVLEMIPGVRRMVMGHTIQSGGITAACTAQAVRIDVGLSRGCGDGQPEVLEINGAGKEVKVLTERVHKNSPRYSSENKRQGVGGEVKEGLAILVTETRLKKEVEAKL